VTGDPVASLSTCEMLLGSSAETNVTTPASGSDGKGSRPYENAAVNVCEETSNVENRRRESCCHEQRKLPCVENLNDCCATRSSSISSEDGTLSLGPAVSVNVEREVCELPVKRTAKTGYEVNQSCGKGGALVPLTLNDTSSIVQRNNTDCKQFEGEVEQGLSVPRNEVNNDGVCVESVENVTGINDAVSLYSNPVQTGPSQSEIQSVEVRRRPARTAARSSRFRDDQFETEFRPGPRKYKVRQVGLDLGKGEPTAVEKEQPHLESKTPAEQGCQALGKGKPNRISV